MTVVQLLAKLGTLGIRLRVEGDRLRYDVPATQQLARDLEAEIRRRKPEIVDFLRTADLARDRPPIPPAPSGERTPASFAQRRFFYVDQLEGPSASYNLPSAFRLRGALDVPALERSIDEISRRHEILRTRFVVDGEMLWQVPREPAPAFPLQLINFAAGDDPVDAALERLIRDEAGLPFDLSGGPHARAMLVRLGPGDHALLVYLHHIVSDDASIGVFVEELRGLYGAYTGASPNGLLPPLPVQYRDFAYWQSAHVTETAIGAQLEYWRRRLADAPQLTELPYDRPRPARGSPDGAEISFDIESEVLARVDAMRLDCGSTRFQVLLAALAILLGKYSRQGTVTIGTSNSIRPAALASVIGPFLNVLPVRVDRGGDPTMRAMVRRVSEASIEALSHGDVPFERIVEAVRPPRSASCSPVFNVLFVLEDVPLGIFDLPGLAVTTLEVPARAVKYDLTLALQTAPRGLVGRFKFRSDLFDASTIRRMVGHYLEVLTALGTDPHRRLSQVSILTAGERTRLREKPATTHSGVPERGVHTMFEALALHQPAEIAIEAEHEGLTLTRADLNGRANRLGRLLQSIGVGVESVVGIALERSVDMVAAVLAVLKAGAAYVPIDPDLPLERQQFLVRDAGVCVLLTQSRLLGSVPHAQTRIALDDAVTLGDLAAQPAGDLAGSVRPDSPCLIVYTSGTTGVPKGVVLEHRALCNNLLWMQDNWPLTGSDAVLLKAAFGFDVCFKEIMWPLITGCRLVVARPGGHKDPAYLHQLIARRGVTVTHLVPSMLEYFLEHHDPRTPTSLRLVMCGGEALTPDLKERFCSRYAAGLLHLYGPSETAIAVTGVLLHREDGRTKVPLGDPTANVQIHLVDADFNHVPVGIAGELCIGGVALARGYLNRPGLTAEKFVPDPFSGRQGARLYCSGDLARYRLNGDIEFLGRMDDQVKLRGVRIELGEIESVLKQFPGVRDGVVTVWNDPSGGRRLIAYVVCRADVAADRSHLLDYLRRRLPSYMVPANVVALESIPVGVNGKADRGALPPPIDDVGRAEPEAPAPGGIEGQLLGLWQDVLQRSDVGRDENFFEAGGHSLLVLQLQRRVKETFGRAVAVADFFLYPTVAQMGRFLAGQSDATRAHQNCQGSVAENAVAVVGLAVRVPGADDAEQYWRNLCGGVDSITTFTREELLADGVPRALLDRPNYVRARGYVPGLDRFDHETFGFTPAEATLLDPQHRLLFECAQRAFDDAGYDPATLHRRSGSLIGVYVGVGRSTYYLNNLQTRPELLETFGPLRLAMATDRSYAATQLAYRLDLRGPSISFDTACSSSLVAIHHACKALVRHEADLALAGGASVDVPLKSGYLCVDGQVGSPDGRCHPFDSRAEGTVKGSGGGVVVLKRLQDAIADRDFVYAVIRGSAVNNDGAAKVGFTAPSVAGQANVIAAALRDSAVPPESIDYIEAHGTGTALGDPIEIAALARVFTTGRIAVGSVKGNVGHLDVAAGITGLVKVVLALHHRQIPASINFDRPNPHIDFSSTPFHVNTELRAWPTRDDAVRRGGVSSFGIGGANAHIIVEEAPAREEIVTAERPELVLLSAPSPASLARQAQGLAEHLRAGATASLPEIAFTLNTGRRRFTCRRSIVCRSVGEFLTQLDHISTAPATAGPDARGSQVDVCFVISADCESAIPLAQAVYAHDAAFRDEFDRCAQYALPILQRDLREAVLHRPSGEPWHDTSIAEALTFAIRYSTARSLHAYGIRPAFLLGASAGELVAGCLAGRLSVRDGMALAIAGGRLMPHGETAQGLPVMSGDGDTGNPGRLTVPMISARTGSWVDETRATDPQFWSLGPHDPMRLEEALDCLLPLPGVVLVEIGSGRRTLEAAQRHPRYQQQPMVEVFGRHRARPGQGILHAVGQLWELGLEVDWWGAGDRLDERTRRAYRRVPLPGHVLQRTSHWLAPELSNPQLRIDERSARETRSVVVPSWVRTSPAAVAPDRRPWLICANDDAVSVALAATLREAGVRVVTVRAGRQFTQLADDVYILNPASISDYRALHETLTHRSLQPGRIVHMWSLASEASRGIGAASLSVSAANLVESLNGADLPMVIAALDLCSVVGDEYEDPAGCELLALAAHCQYRPTVRCVDIARGTPPPLAASGIIDAAENGCPVSAVRGRYRWIHEWRSLPTPSTQAERISLGHEFLIAGGTTPLGLAIAEWLARSGATRLVLIDDGPPQQASAKRLQGLREMGIELCLIRTEIQEGGSRSARAYRALECGLRPRSVDAAFYIVDDAGPALQEEGWMAPAILRGVQDLRAFLAQIGPDVRLGAVIAPATHGPTAISATAAVCVASAAVHAASPGSPLRLITSDVWADLDATRPEILSESFEVLRAALAGCDAREVRIPRDVVIARARLDRAGGSLGPRRPTTDANLSETEQQVRCKWQELLGLRDVSVDADFFESGGDSLLATQLVSRLQELFHVRVPPAQVYERPTIRAIAELIDALRRVHDDAAGLDAAATEGRVHLEI